MYHSIPHMQIKPALRICHHQNLTHRWNHGTRHIVSKPAIHHAPSNMPTCPRTHKYTHGYTDTHTIKPPTAGVQLVGHGSINLSCSSHESTSTNFSPIFLLDFCQVLCAWLLHLPPINFLQISTLSYSHISAFFAAILLHIATKEVFIPSGCSVLSSRWLSTEQTCGCTDQNGKKYARHHI